jgi:nucleotide-binding universal stress UspA family protein
VTNLLILCLDDGPGGAAAARVGRSLARRLCAPLMLATVSPAAPQLAGGFDPAPSLLRQGRSILLRQGRSILADAADGLAPDPVLGVEFGEPAERLVSLAQRERAALLVVGVPHRSSARPLGSVYQALAGTAPCPVVIVSPSVGELSRTAGPIVCGVDGSDQSLAAARVAAELRRQLEDPVRLVHVADRPPLAGRPGDDRGYTARLLASHAAPMRILLRAAHGPQAALDLRVEFGRPGQRLADVAAREGALLIVNGSRGCGSGRSALLGSVSSELARTGPRPLMLVPPGADAAPLDHPRERAEQARRLARPRRPGRRSARTRGRRPVSGRAVSKP